MVFPMAVAENLQLFEAGKKAFSVGLYTIALENFNGYLTEDNLNKKVDALYLSGIAYYYLKEYKESITYLDAIRSEFPNSAYIEPSFYWIGISYYYLNEYENAIKSFNNNINQSSKYRDISLLYKALANIQLNRIGEAKIIFVKMVSDPSVLPKYAEEALYRLSTLYLEEKEYNEAINILNKIIFDYSESKYYEDAISLLSDTYFVLEEWENALRSYELLKEFRQGDEVISKRLATILFHLDRFKESKENLYFYDNNFGSDKDVLLMLGDILLVENNLKDALDVYKKIDENIKLNNVETIENNFIIGKIYYSLGQYNEALNYLKGVNKKESIYLSILSSIKVDKDVFPIIKDLNEKYKSDQITIDSNNRYINYLETKSNNKDLELFLSYVTKIYPKDIKYSLTYGEMLLEQNRLDESLKYLSVGYNKNSEYYSNLSYKIGWIYYNKNEFARSIEYFDRLTEDDYDYIKALYSKSIANYKIGNYTKGKEGFILLLKKDTEFNTQISFYLGLIAKDNYEYDKALDYFKVSKEDKTLYNDSINNIAWCFYHLKQYGDALKIYLDTGNKFNAANCYLFMEEYDNALDLYISITKGSSEFKSSSYYKSIEILFKLDKNEDAINLVKEFHEEFTTSELPGEVILTQGDNLLYSGYVNEAITIYARIMEIFINGEEWNKARYRLAESYNLNKEFEKSIYTYIDSVKDIDVYYEDSVNNIVNILSEVSDPKLTEKVKLKLDSYITKKEIVIPIYIEYIKQSIDKEDIYNEIESLINISQSRDEINQLIFLKSLYYFSILDLVESENLLKVLLERPEVGEAVKIDAIMLQAKIYIESDKLKEAIDLYLNLYVNFSNNIDESSNALYNGLLLTREIGDSQMEEKIFNILKSEYSETIWGRRVVNEN